MPDSSLLVGSTTDPFVLINKGLAWAILIAFILSVIFMFVGGIGFILSGGQDAKIKQSLNTIRYAIIGLVVTIIAAGFIGIIGRAVGLDVISQVVNLEQIWSDVKEIINIFKAEPSTGL